MIGNTRFSSPVAPETIGLAENTNRSEADFPRVARNLIDPWTVPPVEQCRGALGLPFVTTCGFDWIAPRRGDCFVEKKVRASQTPSSHRLYAVANVPMDASTTGGR